MWLTIAGLILTLTSAVVSDEELDFLEQVLEDYLEMGRVEKLIFVATLFVVLMFGISFEVGVVASVATYLATETSFAAIAVGLAILNPFVDSWLGRTIGWNLGSMGGSSASG